MKINFLNEMLFMKKWTFNFMYIPFDISHISQ